MMADTGDLTRYLNNLKLSRLDEDADENRNDAQGAGLWMASLPWPRAGVQEISLGGRETYVQPLGQWPGEDKNAPRRLLLCADGGNAAPQNITLQTGRQSTPSGFETKFRAEMELIERSPHAEYVWERHLLRASYGEKSVGIALGLRVDDEVHWWEACRLIERERTDSCLAVEMGGAIPLAQMSFEEFKNSPGLTNPYLHKHNWVNGQIFARLHSNGVCEIYAHHINSKFFDDGADLQGAVPVIGFQTDGELSALDDSCGEWDGKRHSLQLGAAQFDLTEVARLATPQQPGEVFRDGSFIVLQPYRGMELHGGDCPTQLTGDAFIFRAEQQTIPRGMARTLRFSLSLSDRSPRIVRYMAAPWWYGVCEEFLPQSLLPVANEYDVKTSAASRWISEHILKGGFEG